MPKYRKPGVYINEISKLPPSVAPVETAIPAFVGYTEKREKNGVVLNNATPVKISSLQEFEGLFGGAYGDNLNVTLTGKSTALADTSISVEAVNSISPYNLYQNLSLYFTNGGGPCYVVSIGLFSQDEFSGHPSDVIESDKLLEGLKKLENFDEVTLLVIPEAIHLNQTERRNLHESMLAQCAKLKDRFAIFDVVKVPGGTVESDVSTFRNYIGSRNLKYGAAYYPPLKTSIKFKFKNERTLIADLRTGTVYPEGSTLESVKNGSLADINLYNRIVKEIESKFEVILYPSAAMAGIYVMVDNSRGVWKAPANVSLNAVKEPTVRISNVQQNHMNVDVNSGKSINAIRSFIGKGVLVWGARTLAGNDNEWRYISVRRFFNFVEESVKKSSGFVVFEPNDANTWQKVKVMIENFLTNLWKSGALAGAKPEEAYIVKVGLGQTMSAQDILEGRMIVEIGMAAVRPAEFIIFRFFHKLQKS